MTVKARGVDFVRDLGMGVVGVLKDGSFRSTDNLEVVVGEAVRNAIVYFVGGRMRW